jgi:hypothetical protein
MTNNISSPVAFSVLSVHIDPTVPRVAVQSMVVRISTSLIIIQLFDVV